MPRMHDERALLTLIVFVLRGWSQGQVMQGLFAAGVRKKSRSKALVVDDAMVEFRITYLPSGFCWLISKVVPRYCTQHVLLATSMYGHRGLTAH